MRGVRDEGDCFVRLADAMAGFIRGALEGQPYITTLFPQAKERGFIREKARGQMKMTPDF
ncbi:hypothetical protein A3J36_02710 [Candidatus Uhrbacteria bacterium RIFCSPLOWO2_02_FULL_54_37]|uniref:Uncharacterized protein n=1 Tax=Candidatus Uhrbacteria bacterium RIFCSPLOWO2_02_FULL_54_37 TaxID=1802412 RepID=A0A1F7VHA0_9BACT|nr:MAG: hypothetical protein A3J36_02710 [Candidatus Uhrbacteria bacterium RIFCSPLOWO2_02_FULL_54_37]